MRFSDKPVLDKPVVTTVPFGIFARCKFRKSLGSRLFVFLVSRMHVGY